MGPAARRRLTRKSSLCRPQEFSPAWSPDGETIYFSFYVVKRDTQGDFVGYAWAIYRMRPDGSNMRQLTHPEPTDRGWCLWVLLHRLTEA